MQTGVPPLVCFSSNRECKTSYENHGLTVQLAVKIKAAFADRTQKIDSYVETENEKIIAAKHRLNVRRLGQMAFYLRLVKDTIAMRAFGTEKEEDMSGEQNTEEVALSDILTEIRSVKQEIQKESKFTSNMTGLGVAAAVVLLGSSFFMTRCWQGVTLIGVGAIFFCIFFRRMKRS